MPGGSLPIYKLPGAMDCHVHVLHSQEIPPYSEAILQCRVDVGVQYLPESAYVEPSDAFTDTSGLLGAGMVVDGHHNIIPV